MTLVWIFFLRGSFLQCVEMWGYWISHLIFWWSQWNFSGFQGKKKLWEKWKNTWHIVELHVLFKTINRESLKCIFSKKKHCKYLWSVKFLLLNPVITCDKWFTTLDIISIFSDKIKLVTLKSEIYQETMNDFKVFFFYIVNDSLLKWIFFFSVLNWQECLFYKVCDDLKSRRIGLKI